MPQSPSSISVRVGAIALTGSGLLFFLFPAVRPYFETSPDPAVIASGFASTRWVVAHMLGMLAFVLLGLGMFGLYEFLRDARVRQLALWTLVSTWIGVGLTLPFYGAEAFGLQVIGKEALKHRATDVLAVADAVRFGGLGSYFILLGLVLVAAGAILAAIAVYRSARLPHWSGVPLAVGLGLYIPQYAGPPLVRVADGLLIAVGAVWIAYEMK